VTAKASRIKAWRHDAALFVREVFGIEPDAWQLDALALASGPTNPRRRLVLRACTGPGKSAVLAWLGWHRLLCFADKGEHPKGAALSITADNLKDNLWAELSKWQSRSELLKTAFTWTKERIFANDHPETWFLSARAFAKDADQESIGRTLSGLHSAYAFVLLDEVGDMPLALGRAAEQIFTGGPVDAAIFAAGNPTSLDGLLYNLAVTRANDWPSIVITADPEDHKRTPRVSKEHAQAQIEAYGRDNPWVMSTILGQFPPGAFNALLTVEEVEAAMKRHIDESVYGPIQKRMGVDVARFGDDRTVLFPRQGRAAFKPTILRNMDGPAVAARVAEGKHRWGSEMEFVDGTGGYGAGVIDALRQAGVPAVEVQFAGKAIDPRFYNRRAEMWWKMAEWVKSGGCLPPMPELTRELTAPTYSFQSGRLLMEPKDKIKERLGFSPDLADALACTFATPDQPTQAGEWGRLNLRAQGMRRQTHHEWDPYEKA
jgi:hypothetical protein